MNKDNNILFIKDFLSIKYFLSINQSKYYPFCPLNPNLHYDIIRFKGDREVDDFTFTHQDNNLIIKSKLVDVQIIVQNHFDESNNCRIDAIQFKDGTALNVSQINDMIADTKSATTSTDNIQDVEQTDKFSNDNSKVLETNTTEENTDGFNEELYYADIMPDWRYEE